MIKKGLDEGRHRMGENDDIPLEAITAARDAMADEYITKTVSLERSSLIFPLQKKRIKVKILKLSRYLAQLDAWLKEIKK